MRAHAHTHKHTNERGKSVIIILFLLFQIIYEQEGVYIHSSCGKANDQDSLISGILRVLEKVSFSLMTCLVIVYDSNSHWCFEAESESHM